MLFYNGFIKEIKKLENKYYEIKMLYIDGKSKKDFDLYNEKGEIKSIEFNNNEENDFLKALMYSYALKKYSDLNELEPITNNFNVPSVLIINNVLLALAEKNINIDKHIEEFKDVMRKDSEEPMALLLKDLYDYYIENETVTEEFLDMNIIQKGIVNENNYSELRKLLFKSTAIELILDSSNFDSLDEVEKKLAKYSIFFGSIGNERCREIVGQDLRELARVYYDENLVDEAKIMDVINSIDNIYNYFSDKFKNTNKNGYNFSQCIEKFESLIIANDKEQEPMSKEEKDVKEAKTKKDEKSKLPNFSASRFEIEEAEVKEEEKTSQSNEKLEILVESIKSAKELKEDLEESVELHQVIDELIPAKDIIRKMKAKKEKEIIEQLKKVGEILKTVETDEAIILDFTPLDEVVKILGDKGYKIEISEDKVSLSW